MLEKINIHKVKNLYLRRACVIVLFPFVMAAIMFCAALFGLMAFLGEFKERASEYARITGQGFREAWSKQEAAAPAQGGEDAK